MVSKRHHRRLRRKAKRVFRKKRSKFQASLITREARFSTYPERLWTKLVCHVEGYGPEQIAFQTMQFALNNFGDGTIGGNGVGPQFNYAGGFGLAYPSGLRMLLSTPSTGGASAVAPYSSYIVTHCKFKYRLLPGDLTAGNVASPILRHVVLPEVNEGAYTGVGYNNLAEQPEAKETIQQNNVVSGYVASAITPPTFGSNMPKWIVQNWSLPKLNGVTMDQYIADSNFTAYWNSRTTAGWRTNAIITYQGDNVGSVRPYYQVHAEYTVMFYGRNIMNTLVNV